jgi:hypothetical protein
VPLLRWISRCVARPHQENPLSRSTGSWSQLRASTATSFPAWHELDEPAMLTTSCRTFALLSGMGLRRAATGSYPGIPFEAWVQGVCNKICAAHIRRELSHQTLPLLVDFTTTESSPEVLAVIGIGAGWGSAESCVDQAWAQAMLGLVQRSVSEGTWQLAVSSLVGPRHYGPPSPQDRRRWHAVTVVRQTAKTINTALNCHLEPGLGVDDLCRCAANCLPTTVLRRVAESIVRPGLRGPHRSVQMAALAGELGVTERYIAVNIGFARQLYRAAWRVLQHEANRPAV